MRVKEESEKAELKRNIQKTKIMAFGRITSWQIDGGKFETGRFYFLGLKWVVSAVTKLKDTFSLEEKLWQSR